MDWVSFEIKKSLTVDNLIVDHDVNRALESVYLTDLGLLRVGLHSKRS